MKYRLKNGLVLLFDGEKFFTKKVSFGDCVGIKMRVIQAES